MGKMYFSLRDTAVLELDYIDEVVEVWQLPVRSRTVLLVLESFCVNKCLP